MSGGAFNYTYYKIEALAREIQDKIDDNEEGLCASTLNKIIDAQRTIECASRLARELELFYSGDSSEGVLLTNLEKIY